MGHEKISLRNRLQKEAYYIFVEFETKPEDIAEINRVAKIMDPVMRQMIIKVED